MTGPHRHSACKRLFFLLLVYRIKFNESFAEMNRSTNEWKTIVGTAMFFIGFTALVLIWEKRYGELRGEKGSFAWIGSRVKSPQSHGTWI